MEGQKVAVRDGKLKMGWTEPRPGGELWGLNGVRVDHDDGGAFKAALVRGGGAARRMTAQVALGSGGIGERTGIVRRASAARAGNSPPVAGSRQACRHGISGATAGRRHEVSWMGGRGAPGSKTSTWIMRPRPQTGHSHKDTPVSSSQRSR